MAQTISYEVSLALIFVGVIYLRGRFDFYEFNEGQGGVRFILLVLPIGRIWLIRRLAETNRSPFDFAEGESELVSGFNIEYGRGGFAILFMAEYGRIILIRVIFIVLMLGLRRMGVRFYVVLGIIIYFFI